MKHARRLKQLARIVGTVSTFDEPWRRLPVEYWKALHRLREACDSAVEKIAVVLEKRVQLKREGVPQSEAFQRVPFPSQPLNYPGIDSDRELIKKCNGEFGLTQQRPDLTDAEKVKKLRTALAKGQQRIHAGLNNYEDENGHN